MPVNDTPLDIRVHDVGQPVIACRLRKDAPPEIVVDPTLPDTIVSLALSAIVRGLDLPTARQPHDES
jgi:hypothetical protein